MHPLLQVHYLKANLSRNSRPQVCNKSTYWLESTQYKRKNVSGIIFLIKKSPYYISRTIPKCYIPLTPKCYIPPDAKASGDLYSFHLLEAILLWRYYISFHHRWISSENSQRVQIRFQTKQYKALNWLFSILEVNSVASVFKFTWSIPTTEPVKIGWTSALPPARSGSVPNPAHG